MVRRIDRSIAYHGGDREQALEELEGLVVRLSEAGYLDDVRYARARAEDLHRRGTSMRAIRAKLRQKGLSSEEIEGALGHLSAESEDPDLVAAVAYARRRRLGPFRLEEVPDQARRRREFGALARAGFPAGLARRIIDAKSIDELESDHF